MKNRNKKRATGVFIYLSVYFFCIGMGWRAPDWNATFKNSRDPAEAFQHPVSKMCILFYQFFKKRGAEWHLYLKYAQMFLQTTNLCLIHFQDKGSSWIPEREQCMCTWYALPFKSQKESSSLVSKRLPRPTASQATANVLTFIKTPATPKIYIWPQRRGNTDTGLIAMTVGEEEIFIYPSRFLWLV